MRSTSKFAYDGWSAAVDAVLALGIADNARARDVAATPSRNFTITRPAANSSPEPPVRSAGVDTIDGRADANGRRGVRTIAVSRPWSIAVNERNSVNVRIAW